MKLLGLEGQEVYEIAGPLDLKAFMGWGASREHSRLRFNPWRSSRPAELPEGADLWEVVKRQDVLLHHPYDSFDPVVELLSRAASDPQVLAIKMILYRTSGDSPTNTRRGVVLTFSVSRTW